ncbi:hypothetical protein VNI00_017003 [Paramarasmius palmivorus]|uniref:CxC2-like cysteine cluster KDZ transposase-associated domain-containing protein n=1 Tax=Paramarasmius palmivorus TaxID=297713 RepID=A0AAW0BAM8_9AGAR
MSRAKRRRTQSNTYQDRVRFEDDEEDIPYREEGVNLAGGRNILHSSPGKGRHWSAGAEWNTVSVGSFGEWEGFNGEEEKFSEAGDETMEDVWEDIPAGDNPGVDAFAEEHGSIYDDLLDSTEKSPAPVINPEENGPMNGGTVPKKRATKSYKAKRPNIYWQQNLRDVFVTEILRSKGRSDVRKQRSCTDCRGVDPSGVLRASRVAKYRCKDCFFGDLEWNGDFFEKTSLRAMGLIIQLNHMGMECVKARKCHSKMRVLHTNGIHEVDIRFCHCHKRIDQFRQLLRRGLYPSTVNEGHITTCATFAYLETLRVMSSTTKGSTHDFYRALEKLTDNTGLVLPKSRYRPLLRMIRQWRHIKLVIWSGAAHDEAGIGDKEGRLVVQCPSCPHPGINLPVNWQDASRRFLYRLILCLDGNFRLKAQMVSSHSRDPPLNQGMGYFVKRVPYENWVFTKDDGDEISNCVPLAAIAKQNTKFSKGLRYTGVMGVACGRSDMIVRVGNLQKGERYSNTDWIFAKALEPFLLLLELLAIYDVACQWFIHLLDRITRWPKDLSWNNGMDVTPGIGKMHEPGHKQENHEQYSLNTICGAGNTDGETLERIWGEHNNLGNATKTMGPGSREDYIDAQMGEWNFEKYKAMGASLQKRYMDAEKDLQMQMTEYRGLSANIPAHLTLRWKEMCKVWEAAPTPKLDVPNPYHVGEEFMSEDMAMEELAIEEQERLAEGGVKYHAVDAPGFVKMALSLKDSQQKLLQQQEEQTRIPTSRQAQKLRDHRNALARQLQAYNDLRVIYMPGLIQYLEDAKLSEDLEDTEPERADVWLPSSLPQAQIDRVCVPELRRIEGKLQYARCYDSLDGLRHSLRIKTRMMLFKNTNIRGQRSSGRAWEIINRVVSRIQRWATRYRISRDAFHKLTGPGNWEQQLKVLNTEDIRSFKDPALLKVRRGRMGNDEEDEEEHEMVKPLHGTATSQTDRPLSEWDLIPPDRTEWEHRRVHGTGNTRKSISWIWWRGGSLVLEDGADENDNEVLRSEWCKARARAMRAWEELMLVREEMRRTLEYLEWRAREWDEYAKAELAGGEAEREGQRAFALRQGRIQRSLKASFEKKWGRLVPRLQEWAAVDTPFPDYVNDDDQSEKDGDMGEDKDLEGDVLIDGESSNVDSEGSSDMESETEYDD